MRQDDQAGALDLVVRLCAALEAERVRYCHWKSNEAIARSASGENDLDLLIDRADADRFGAVLHDLGFKEARPLPSREVPGLIDHYGFDAGSGRLVHLQAHYQLVLGDDMTKNVHLPVEHAYLDSVSTDGLFPLPAPELELAVFVVRMVLKHSTWDAQLCLLGDLSASEQRELSWLFARVPQPGRAAAVTGALPFLTDGVLERCLRSLEERSSRRERAAVARALEHDLEPYVRSGRHRDLTRRIVRRGLRGARHLVGPPARKRLVNGGAMVAVVGPDRDAARAVGDDLTEWLGAAFVVGRFESDGADRASRFAGNGGIAVCDEVAAVGGPRDVVIEVGPADRDGGPAARSAIRRRVWAAL